ncbi:hypothetical protein FIV07_25810 [Mycobacterium sp. THAF192]|nr:hypothetical protein FIV07_25810 [Mycobacterium sp. THAF192]
MSRAAVAVAAVGAVMVLASCASGDAGVVDGDTAADTAAAPTTVPAPPETRENRFLSKITHHQLLVWTDEELLAAGYAVCDRLNAGQDGLTWIAATYGISNHAAANLHVTATKTLGCAQ